MHTGGCSRSDGVSHLQGVGKVATDRHGVSAISLVYREAGFRDDRSLFDAGIVGRGICWARGSRSVLKRTWRPGGYDVDGPADLLPGGDGAESARHGDAATHSRAAGAIVRQRPVEGYAVRQRVRYPNVGSIRCPGGVAHQQGVGEIAMYQDGVRRVFLGYRKKGMGLGFTVTLLKVAYLQVKSQE